MLPDCGKSSLTWEFSLFLVVLIDDLWWIEKGLVNYVFIINRAISYFLINGTLTVPWYFIWHVDNENIDLLIMIKLSETIYYCSK